MYDISCDLIDNGSKIIQINVDNFDKFGPFHTFLTITKLDTPHKVPHLLALGHIWWPLCTCPFYKTQIDSIDTKWMQKGLK